jgi:hypothetical protein
MQLSRSWEEGVLNGTEASVGTRPDRRFRRQRLSTANPRDQGRSRDGAAVSLCAGTTREIVSSV